MDSLDAQRQENIKRNQNYLRELGIYRENEVVGTTPAPRSAKRRKIRDEQPSRISARIASAAVAPIYTNNHGQTTDPKERKKALTKRVSSTRDANQSKPQIVEDEKAALLAEWINWTPSAASPIRDDESTFHFESHPDFTPNKSPEEMLREGCFGGSYFRPLYSRKLKVTVTDDYKELPQAWYPVDKALRSGKLLGGSITPSTSEDGSSGTADSTWVDAVTTTIVK
ncbi:MAG: hypothetical protein LQ345_006393 [Seirophora villosa]|nr:MAG: hypothetical protein LQ345_006393 [Seirophora villosa]